MLRPLLLVLATLVLPACSLVTGMKEPRLLYGQHPLVDKIWDVEAGVYISRQELMARTGDSRYLLLGEIHDNPLHHQHQAEMIAALPPRSAAVVFEMIDDTQAGLMAEAKPQTTGELIDILDRVDTGWGYDPLYEPVFAAAMASAYPILPGSLARPVIVGLMRQDDTQPPEAIGELMQRTPLNDSQRAALEREIEGSHCGMLHGGMADGMIRAQRAKDATMAWRMIEQADVDVRVLVAGAGHTRNDRGVPLYLRSQDGGAGILSVGWMEVLPGTETIVDYSRHWSDGRLPFDYVWFTPRMEREDPCAGMRAHFRKDG